MNFQEWLLSVPPEITGDALWSVKVWMIPDQRGTELRDESPLYQATGSELSLENPDNPPRLSELLQTVPFS